MNRLFLSLVLAAVFFSSVLSEERKEDISVLLVPFPIYSEETSLKGILTLGLFYNKKPDTFTSNAQLYLSASLKQQFSAEVETWNYTDGNDMKFYMDAWHKKNPDSFFGTGNSTLASDEDRHTFQMNKVLLEMHKKIAGALYGGIRYRMEHFVLLKSEENGIISKGIYNGSRGGVMSGAGALISYDTRDNTMFARRGCYITASAEYYGKKLGSGFEFMRYEADIREYFKIDEIQSLAFQQFAGLVPGNTPFQMMQQLGGDNKMRGYFYGRYRDKGMIMGQAEYRIMPWERLGFAAFFGAGDVFDSDIKNINVKYAGGIGIRICLVPEERANIRMDIGYGRDGMAFIVNAFEAF